MAKLESILQYIESAFQVSDFPDYTNALNGLQVDGPDEVTFLAAAVDASETTIESARRHGADLLLVHHGLFWDGFGPLTGPRYRKVASLIEGSMGLYGLHLPLDAHAQLGNCALLARAIGVEPQEEFAAYKDVKIGWYGRSDLPREALRERIEKAVGGPVRMIAGGREEVGRVGILTGGGASALAEAAALGLDGLVTGEAAHHHYHEAMELGVNLYLAGHYATETFGVKALGETLGEAFDLQWTFLDHPTGL